MHLDPEALAGAGMIVPLILFCFGPFLEPGRSRCSTSSSGRNRFGRRTDQGIETPDDPRADS